MSITYGEITIPRILFFYFHASSLIIILLARTFLIMEREEAGISLNNR